MDSAPAVTDPLHRHPPMQPDWIERPHLRIALGDFVLESGETIRDLQISYVVHGPGAGDAGSFADSDRPVVLALCAIGSSHHRLDFLIGPGRALDPERHTIVVIDAIGNGLSTSPSTTLLQPGLSFPRFTIRDMVASQAAVLDRLGIGRLDAVVGASMGGMQALQWAVSHPRRMRRIVALTPMARASVWSIAVNETARRALFADPHWSRPEHDGPPSADTDWSTWVPLMQLIAARTPAQLDRQFGNAAQLTDWIAQRVRWQQQQRMRAVDWVYQSWAYDAHDVGAGAPFNGDTVAALASIEAQVLVLASPMDLYNPVSAARDAASAIPGARFVTIESDWGHQVASAADELSVPKLNDEIGRFLQQGD